MSAQPWWDEARGMWVQGEPPTAGCPSAGWYPDPEWHGYQRYWDGVQWTQHRAPAREQKSSAVAALLTFLWPGAGHFYLGLTSKGLPYFVINGVLLVLTLMTWIFLPLGFLVWVVTLCMTIGSVTRDTAVVNRRNLR